jgi:hypothetical protein
MNQSDTNTTDQTDQSNQTADTSDNMGTAAIANAGQNQDNQSVMKETVPASSSNTAAMGSSSASATAATATRQGEQPAALFSSDESQGFRDKWNTIQAGFVDDPRKSVEAADDLVAEVMQRLAQLFADERKNLESQWEQGDNVSTEDLRVALQRYRSFFDRLLSA